MPAQQSDSVKYTNMFKAYGAFWRRGFTEWAGTASRSEYWWTYLVNFLLGAVALFIVSFFAVLGLAVESEGVVASGLVLVLVPAMLYWIVTLVPGISLIVRRLHDAGLSSWFMVLYGVGIFFRLFGWMIVGISPWTAGFGVFLWFISFCIDITFFVFSLLPTKVEDNPYHQFNK